MTSSIQRAESLFKANGGMLRTRDAIRAGVHPRTLYGMRDAGFIEQANRGIFRLAGLPPMANPDLALTAKRVPSAIVCLISALAFHELTTQIPHTVQIALRPGSWTPKIEHPPIEVFHFSPESLSAGVEDYLIDGVTVHIFSQEKTLADIFKFRNRIGIEVAVEALRNYARGKPRRFDQVLDFARVCRVESVMRPYLEALA
ncbi:MAG TPA: type IV toxin-antitoxin system AbiEi family antitoxin domain-containing protein [Candidatus Methylacidiphilales bacterium]|nr:type IV toxin-antitoxin system AbiEi family antitoxin domain-containing protein [Candidatus Methylacidiphilales bacterium]